MSAKIAYTLDPVTEKINGYIMISEALYNRILEAYNNSTPIDK